MAEGGRVVPLSSIAAKRARLHFDDPMFERRYDAWAAYCQSKLAMLIFARELAQRQQRIASIAAHPGFARTQIVSNGPGDRSVRGTVYRLFAGLYSQSAASGALPVLRAATDPGIASGDYIGSIGPFEMTGPPGPGARPTCRTRFGFGPAVVGAVRRVGGPAFPSLTVANRRIAREAPHRSGGSGFGDPRCAADNSSPRCPPPPWRPRSSRSRAQTRRTTICPASSPPASSASSAPTCMPATARSARALARDRPSMA